MAGRLIRLVEASRRFRDGSNKGHGRSAHSVLRVGITISRGRVVAESAKIKRAHAHVLSRSWRNGRHLATRSSAGNARGYRPRRKLLGRSTSRSFTWKCRRLTGRMQPAGGRTLSRSLTWALTRRCQGTALPPGKLRKISVAIAHFPCFANARHGSSRRRRLLRDSSEAYMPAWTNGTGRGLMFGSLTVA